MSKYGLYVVGSNEKITTSYHRSHREALNYFTHIKKLPLDVFITMFRVEEIPEKDENRSTKNQF